MSRFLVVLLVALVLGVAAFRSPARLGGVASKAIASKSSLSMAPAEVVVQASNVLSQFSNLVSSETDFGGYTGPAASLIFIGFIILTFAPPLAQKE